jgi:hypothetical protein
MIVSNELLKYLVAALYINSITKGINERFNCWGKKGQATNNNIPPMAVKKKYFFTQGLPLFIKKEMMRWVGHDQSKL